MPEVVLIPHSFFFSFVEVESFIHIGGVHVFFLTKLEIIKFSGNPICVETIRSQIIIYVWLS